MVARLDRGINARPRFRPRLGLVTPPKYIETPIEVPAFTSIEEAESFLLQLAQREASQELDSESVATVCARVLDWIHSKRAGQELEVKRINAAAADPSQEQRIIIEGGLPELPGTNVIMPQLNGQHLELTATKTDPTHPAHDPQAHPPEESKPK